LATKCVTSGVGFAVADVVAQSLSRGFGDYERTAADATFGLVLYGPRARGRGEKRRPTQEEIGSGGTLKTRLAKDDPRSSVLKRLETRPWYLFIPLVLVFAFDANQRRPSLARAGQTYAHSLVDPRPVFQ
jgi:hypothetical protein